MLPGSAGKRISEEEDSGEELVTSSSASLAWRLEQLDLNAQTQSVCVRGGVDSRYCFIIITHAFWLKLCGHRHTAVPGDINEQDVVRERAAVVLKLLLTTVAFCHNNFLNAAGEVGLEVVVCAACTLTTTSMLAQIVLGY